MCRLEIYKKSFFPSAISLWNSLPIDIRNIMISKAVSIKPAPPPKHFFFGERKFSIIHTRLRNNCCNLNNYLFLRHISLSNSCISGDTPETAYHYFLVCKKFIVEREHMFHLLDNNSLPIDINCLLYGSISLTDDNNMKLFEIV